MVNEGEKHTIIAINRDVSAELLDEVPTTIRSTVIGIVSGGWLGTRYFTPDGRVRTLRRLSPPSPIGRFAEWLAYAGYNPWREATVECDIPRPYAFAELADALRAVIEDDDDILTQLVEKADLLRDLASATTHADCVALLRQADSPAT